MQHIQRGQPLLDITALILNIYPESFYQNGLLQILFRLSMLGYNNLYIYIEHSAVSPGIVKDKV